MLAVFVAPAAEPPERVDSSDMAVSSRGWVQGLDNFSASASAVLSLALQLIHASCYFSQLAQ
jgi:hypothetical protein